MTDRFPMLAAEFPDFDQSTLPEIPAHWVETSWHNDTCPSFAPSAPGEGALVRIYVDYADEADSESARDGRYAVTVTAANGDHVPESDLETDDWAAVLAHVAETALVIEYQEYCDGHKLPAMSADELLCELYAPPPEERSAETNAHCAWLRDFIERWDAVFHAH